MTKSKLPRPDSPELRVLLPGAEHRRIYKFLYERRDDPPTKVEIFEHLAAITGEWHAQRDRRLRDLYPIFEITRTKERVPRYILVGLKASAPKDDAGINLRVRAQVLQPQRCAMCGRTPLEDGVKLVVDHKLPKSWGGTDDPENLQPLCTDCNHGKKHLFETFNEFTPQIRKAATCDEPQRRIGELLLAFDRAWVPSELIGMVASAKDFQEDWQRRLRDLRYIGWDYEHKKQREGGRVRTYYRLTRRAPWPKNIKQAIRAEFDRRSAADREGGKRATR